MHFRDIGLLDCLQRFELKDETAGISPAEKNNGHITRELVPGRLGWSVLYHHRVCKSAEARGRDMTCGQPSRDGWR
jgi:hypothetical protein